MARTALSQFLRLLESIRICRISALIFSIGLLLRALPEFLSGPYPVGYDALVGYLPSIQRFPDVAVLRLFGWIWAPLGLCLMWALSLFSFGHIYLFLKIFGPFLYGCLAVSFYLLVRAALHLGRRESLAASLVFVMQPATLSICRYRFR